MQYNYEQFSAQMRKEMPPVFQFSKKMTNLNIFMGVCLNGGTPKTPQNDHF